MAISVNGDYPAELVEQVRELYATHTMHETAQLAGIAIGTLQRLMARHGITARPVGSKIIPAAQAGPLNHQWTGDRVGYHGAHDRVRRTRGKATRCIFGCHARRYVWANLTGDYPDPADYAEMCGSCHWRYDVARKSMLPDFRPGRGWPRRIRSCRICQQT